MTHPTKAIYKWLIQDSVRVGNISSSAETKVQMYTEADHLSTFPQIEAIDFYTTFFHDTGRPECTTFEEQLQMADGECDIFTITVEEIHTHEMVWESWKCSLDNLKHGNKTLNSVFQIGQ